MQKRKFIRLMKTGENVVALYRGQDGTTCTLPVPDVGAFILSHSHRQPVSMHRAIKRLEAYDRDELQPPKGKPLPKRHRQLAKA